jgi:hypothetical protein
MKGYQKTIATIALFFVVFFVLYFLLSAVGLMFKNTYAECIGSIGWFVMYTLFGTVISGMISQEFYEES